MYHVRDFDVIVTGNMFGNIQCLASFAEIDALHVPWGTVRTEWRKRARHCGTGKGKCSRANSGLHWCSCQFETEVAAIEVAVVEVLESGLLTGSCTGTIETVQFPPSTLDDAIASALKVRESSELHMDSFSSSPFGQGL